MARVMFIDTARYLWFGIIAGVCALVLLGAVLLGFLGPEAHAHTVDYAYECPNSGHVFNSSCSGVQLGVGCHAPKCKPMTWMITWGRGMGCTSTICLNSPR